MKRKIISILLIASLAAVALVGCGVQTTEESETEDAVIIEEETGVEEDVEDVDEVEVIEDVEDVEINEAKEEKTVEEDEDKDVDVEWVYDEVSGSWVEKTVEDEDGVIGGITVTIVTDDETEDENAISEEAEE